MVFSKISKFCFYFQYKKICLVFLVVPHDTEYYFITGAPFMDPKIYPTGLYLQDAKWTESDRNLSMFFMTAWANFAKFGYVIDFMYIDVYNYFYFLNLVSIVIYLKLCGCACGMRLIL